MSSTRRAPRSRGRAGKRPAWPPGAGREHSRPVSPSRRWLLVALGAVRHRELWIGAALGVAFIPFAVELTSYYYAFLVVPALLWTVRREAGIALLLLGAFGLFVSLAPLAGMPTWRDEQYTLISLATLLTLLFLLLRFAFSKPLFQPPSRPV